MEKTALDALTAELAEKELDSPLRNAEIEKVVPPSLTQEEVDKEKRKYAIGIFKLCFAVLAGILVGDNIISICITKQPSVLNTTAIDLIKTVVLLALGYLFNKNDS